MTREEAVANVMGAKPLNGYVQTTQDANLFVMAAERLGLIKCEPPPITANEAMQVALGTGYASAPHHEGFQERAVRVIEVLERYGYKLVAK